jgi:hypothetical protein
LEPLLAEATSTQAPAQDQILYCMADGSMLFTDQGWQEVKLGGVFSELPGQEALPNRPFLAASQEVAHLGNNQEFACKMDGLVKG